jgi:hypothetical protein
MQVPGIFCCTSTHIEGARGDFHQATNPPTPVPQWTSHELALVWAAQHHNRRCLVFSI